MDSHQRPDIRSTPGRRPSRRVFLGGAVAGTAALVAGGAAPWNPAASASAPSERGVVDTVLRALARHRLVAMAEAHGLQEFHDLVALVLRDPRVAAVVDDVVVEFGNSLHQATVDAFVAGGIVDNVDLRPVWRDTTQSPLETWDSPVYEQFFRTVRGINWGRSKRIRVLLGDPPIDWSRVTSTADVRSFLVNRNPFMASVIVEQVLRRGRRALVIAGGDHVFHNPTAAPGAGSAIVDVEQQTGERAYVISETVFAQREVLARLAGTPVPSVIPTAGTWLGSLTADQVVAGSPIGGTHVLSDVVDAVLYLGQPERLTLSYWNPAIYLDPAYWAELQRRDALSPAHPALAHLREERPALYRGLATET